MAGIKKLIKNKGWEVGFLAPAVILFIFVVAEPFFRGFLYSFTNWDGISKTYDFVGLKNYLKFFRDPTVLLPMKNSFYYTAITVVCNNLVGLGLALALNNSLRGTKFFRTIFFVPFVISFVLSGFLWSYMYTDVIGPLFGINSLLGNPKTVIFGIAMISLWRDSGYVMVIYLAGLQSIPNELYESAKVDGANVFQKFFKITVPMLVPAFTINFALFIGWGIKVFDYVMAATGGGPGKSSETLALYVYKYTFTYNKVGYGQTVAIYMMALVFILSGITAAYFRKREVEM